MHVEALRTLVEHDIATKQDIAELRKEIQQGIESLRKKRDVKLAELNISLVKEIATAKAKTIKWVAGMIVAQGAVVATLVILL